MQISAPTKLLLRADAEAATAKEMLFEPTQTFSGRVLLFLDFDGVLHPFVSYHTREGLFSKLYLLVDVLKDFPDVRIVISSKWAEKYSLESNKKHFPEFIQKRIIGGITNQSKYRYKDVWRYMKDRGITDPWIAVDDMALFLDNDPVVWTDWETGLTDETAMVLRKALSSPLEFKQFRENENELV